MCVRDARGAIDRVNTDELNLVNATLKGNRLNGLLVRIGTNSHTAPYFPFKYINNRTV